jgi:hypothetical protein
VQALSFGATDDVCLGLYRIAAEGGFALECRYGDEVVTVIATRSIR